MVTHTLIPNTELRPFPICLGTGRLGTATPHADAFTLLDAFVDQGGNFLDTAHVYGNWVPDAPRSASERTIGAWMVARGNRDKILVGTKGAHPDLATMHLPRLTPHDIVQDMNESLAHLQTDYIDLYWLHRDDPFQPVGEILETLDAQMRAGKIRAYGCSNWSTARMTQAHDYARTHDLRGFVANQPLWSLARPNPAALGMPGMAALDEEMMAFHQRTGLAIIPYSSQARGLFTKLERAGVEGLSEGERKAYLNDKNLNRWRRAQELAYAHNATITQIVLAYLLAQPVPTIPVVGCRTVAQLTDTLRAVNVHLSTEEVLSLTGL